MAVGTFLVHAAYVHSFARGGLISDVSVLTQYANYGLGDERVRDVFGENYDRLAQLKASYDPHNVFHKWFPVAPKA
jgi:FAD/FMN-containing dehydrogenase